MMLLGAGAVLLHDLKCEQLWNAYTLWRVYVFAVVWTWDSRLGGNAKMCAHNLMATDVQDLLAHAP